MLKSLNPKGVYLVTLFTRAWVLWGELENKSFEVSRLPVAIFQAILFNYHGKTQPPLRSLLLGFTVHYFFSGIGWPSLLSHAPSFSERSMAQFMVLVHSKPAFTPADVPALGTFPFSSPPACSSQLHL